jgi:hypothetical protein
VRNRYLRHGHRAQETPEAVFTHVNAKSMELPPGGSFEPDPGQA